MTMNWRVFIKVLLLASVGLSKSSEGKQAVVVPISDFPPFIYQSDEKMPQGVLGELVVHMLKEAGLEASHPYIPLKRLLRMTQAGQVDIAITAKNVLPERFYHISPKPLVDLKTKIYWLKKKPAPPPLQDLKNIKLGTVAGFQYGNILRQISASESISIESVRLQQLLIKILMNGSIDYAISYKNTFETLKAYDESLISNRVISNNQLHLAVNRKFNNSRAMYDALYNSYLGSEKSGLKAELMKKYLQPREELGVATESEKVRLCSSIRDRLSEKDGSGFYIDLLRQVYRLEGMEIAVTVIPFDQCHNMLKGKRVDGAVGMFKTPERELYLSYPNTPIHYSSYGVVSLKKHAFPGFKRFDGKISKIKGYNFAEWLPETIEVFPVESTVQAINMLKNDRILFHADDLFDVDYALEKLNEDRATYAYKELHQKSLYVPFTRDTRGKLLAEIFDNGFSKLIASGEVEKIAAKYKVKSNSAPPLDTQW